MLRCAQLQVTIRDRCHPGEVASGLWTLPVTASVDEVSAWGLGERVVVLFRMGMAQPLSALLQMRGSRA